ncbi:MAG: methylmalonyl-CoA epimerase [Candidatus Zixiibacteriota bacterium]
MTKPLVSHIGIAVADLEQAISRYRMLTGQNEPLIEEVPDQKVRVAMFSGNTKVTSVKESRIELVAATAPDSPIARFIAKRGEGLHHICIYVDDIEEKLSELKTAGVRLIDKTPRMGAEGRKIAFVHPAGMNGVLIELSEAPKS